MSLQEIIEGGGITLVVILSIIQISPIKVNPWSWITRNLGKALTATVLEKIDKNEAETHRYRILRFNDEIQLGEKHSKEHFNQILEDIDLYERYCKEHPEYPNNKAVIAIEQVKQTYKKCENENSFI